MSWCRKSIIKRCNIFHPKKKMQEIDMVRRVKNINSVVWLEWRREKRAEKESQKITGNLMLKRIEATTGCFLPSFFPHAYSLCFEMTTKENACHELNNIWGNRDGEICLLQNFTLWGDTFIEFKPHTVLFWHFSCYRNLVRVAYARNLKRFKKFNIFYYCIWG